MGKYILRKTNTGFKFDLKASNGEVIATSEVYTTKEACKNGIESVKRNALDAAVENQTQEGYETQKNPKFEIYLDKAGEPRFRLKATNGQIIVSSEAYSSMQNCTKGIESVKKNADSPIEEQL